MKCEIPPKGWLCTREAPHDGPCAAVPDDGYEHQMAVQDVKSVRDLFRWPWLTVFSRSDVVHFLKHPSVPGVLTHVVTRTGIRFNGRGGRGVAIYRDVPKQADKLSFPNKPLIPTEPAVFGERRCVPVCEDDPRVSRRWRLTRMSR